MIVYLVLLSTSPLDDFCNAPCKHTRSELHFLRNIRQAYGIWKHASTLHRALLLGRSGQAGSDSEHASWADLQAVAKLTVPPQYKHAGSDEGPLYCISALQKFGLPYKSLVSSANSLPATCPLCYKDFDSAHFGLDSPPLYVKLFLWQMHMGRCTGPGGRILQVHEVSKLALMRLCLCHHDPGGVLCPTSSISCEPRHLRHDGSKPGDLYRTVPGAVKDIAMDVTTSSCSCPSHVVSASSSTDKHIRAAENLKFDNDLKSCYPLLTSSSIRLVPLAANQFGRRGPHFQALLAEYASELVLRPSGCSLLSGPSRQSPREAVQSILRCWGARLTLVYEREHAAQILRAIDSAGVSTRTVVHPPD